ncbi:hypothetical protein HerbRD11066_74450 [Herbidospora sp. RD11066]
MAPTPTERQDSQSLLLLMQVTMLLLEWALKPGGTGYRSPLGRALLDALAGGGRFRPSFVCSQQTKMRVLSGVARRLRLPFVNAICLFLPPAFCAKTHGMVGVFI